MQVIDVSSTLAMYLKNVDIPFNSMGWAQPYYGKCRRDEWEMGGNCPRALLVIYSQLIDKISWYFFENLRWEPDSCYDWCIEAKCFAAQLNCCWKGCLSGMLTCCVRKHPHTCTHTHVQTLSSSSPSLISSLLPSARSVSPSTTTSASSPSLSRSLALSLSLTLSLSFSPLSRLFSNFRTRKPSTGLSPLPTLASRPTRSS